MPSVWRLRIEDILEAINNIAEDIAGMEYPQFLNDRKTRNSVVRELQIIGEAAFVGLRKKTLSLAYVG